MVGIYSSSKKKRHPIQSSPMTVEPPLGLLHTPDRLNNSMPCNRKL